MATLLAEVMPEYHFKTAHRIAVLAEPSSIMAAMKESRPSEIPLFTPLFWLRSLPYHLTGKGHGYFHGDRPVLEQVLDLGFAVLAEEPHREFVFGAIGNVWRPWGATFEPISGREDFLRFEKPGLVKVAAHFYVDANGKESVAKLRTETRVYATDAAARRKFGAYWLLVYPGVTLLRRTWLRSIKRRAERR